MLSQDLANDILTTRPYSWVTSILIGIAVLFLAVRTPSNLEIFLTSVVSLNAWILGQTLPEFFRKKFEYEESSSLGINLIPLVSLILLVGYYNIISLFFVLTLVLGILIYIQKVRSDFFGKISFILRGISEVSLGLIIFSMFRDLELIEPLTVFLIAIFLITDSRNLIGDLRDVRVDQHTLANWNFKLSTLIAVGLGIAGGLILPISVSIPVLASLGFTILHQGRNAHLNHRIFVLGTMFTVANYILLTEGSEFLLVSNLLFLGSTLNLTYDYVPRKVEKLGESDG